MPDFEPFRVLVVDRWLFTEKPPNRLSEFALKEIQTASTPIDAVVLGDGIQRPGPISIIKAIHERRPGTPIFFLEGEAAEHLKRETEYLGLQKELKRTRDLELLKDEIFDRTKIATFAKRMPMPHHDGAPNELVDRDYVRVSAKNFLWSRHTVLDVYVRLNGGRYLKILNKSEGFDESRLVGYINRGVQHFYIRVTDQVRLIQSCDEVARRLRLDDNAPARVHAAPVLQLGELAIDFFSRHGAPTAGLQAAFEFTRQLGTLVKRPEWRRDTTIRLFLDDLTAYEHGMAVALVAVLILRQMQLQSTRLNHAIGIGALFHDIGLHGLLGSDAEHEPNKLSPSDRRLLENHPILGAKALGRGPGVDPIILKIIEQHHERRCPGGYPFGVSGSEVQPLAQIVGIADELVLAVLLANKKPGFNVEEHIESKVFNGFSSPVIEAVSQLLRLDPNQRKFRAKASELT